MTVLQDVYLRCELVLEEEEIAALQETRILPAEVLARGVSVQAEGGHYIPADHSWTGDDVTVAVEEGFVFTAFVDDEPEEQDPEEKLEEEFREDSEDNDD